MIEWTSTSCPLQEVLLHHSTEGPRVSIPQWMEARATRGHMENLPAHVRWTDPHTGGAALLLRGLRLVRLHPAAVHGLSLQPGQQQTGQSNRSLCHTDVTVTDSEMFNTLLNCFKNENIQMWELTFELLPLSQIELNRRSTRNSLWFEGKVHSPETHQHFTEWKC